MAAVAKGKSNSRRAAFKQEAPSLKLVDNTTAVPKREVVLKARTPGQRHYINELTKGSSSFVVAIGPAGTGKTYSAVLYAIQQLRDPESPIKKVIITRPNVGAGEDLGFLPGDLNQKMEPWMLPILDAFHEYYSAYQVEQMLKTKVIEMAPLVFMRGRTLKSALVIGDEMQNATPDQMKMFLTRIGEGSRYIVTGDIEQYDRIVGVSGMKDLLRRIKYQTIAREARDAERDDGATEVTAISLFELGIRDVVRHPAIPEVLELFAE